MGGIATSWRTQRRCYLDATGVEALVYPLLLTVGTGFATDTDDKGDDYTVQIPTDIQARQTISGGVFAS